MSLFFQSYGKPSVGARYTTAAGQSIANATLTIVNFGTMVFDYTSAVTTGASWKFTAPMAGLYSVGSFITFNATTAWSDAESIEFRIYKNNTLYSIIDLKTSFGSTSSVYATVGGSDLIKLAATDFIDIRTYQDSGSSQTLAASGTSNYVSILRVDE